MNWKHLRAAPWLDTRARFVSQVPPQGSLLDLGSSDGGTLGHFHELRPDLQFHSVDIAGEPDRYPPGCRFHRADLEKDALPWEDGTFDAITCMHLVEHLEDPALLFSETARLLRPGGRAYFETPHPRTLVLTGIRGRAAGSFTMNFHDDLTHTRPVSAGAMARRGMAHQLEVVRCGISRNWIFALAWPLYLFLPPGPRKHTARIHWLGWSSYLVLRRPG